MEDTENAVIEDINDEIVAPARRRRVRHTRRKALATPRKKRPFPDVQTMSFECRLKRTCLETIGRDIVERIRRDFDRMLYEAQSNYLISLIDITPKRGKPTRIVYNIRDGSGLVKFLYVRRLSLK